MMDIETGPEEPTSHELASKGSVAGWDKVRQGMLKAVTEGAGLPFVRVHMLQCIYILQCTFYAYSGMPEDLKCTVCANLASMRCHRCGPLGFFCPECFRQYHADLNLFHIGE